MRPRLLSVLFMRKEKRRSVGASRFFLDRPEEGAGEGGAGHRVQGPVPSSTPASSSKSRPETREAPPGVCYAL